MHVVMFSISRTLIALLWLNFILIKTDYINYILVITVYCLFILFLFLRKFVHSVLRWRLHSGKTVANYRGCHIAILLPRWQKPPSHPEIIWREFSALTFDSLSEYIFRHYTLVGTRSLVEARPPWRFKIIYYRVTCDISCIT